MTLIHSTGVLIHSTWLYYTPTMAQPHSTIAFLYILQWPYFTLHEKLHSTVVLIRSTSLYYILAWLYYILPRLYWTLLASTTFYHGSSLLYLDLLHPTMALLHSPKALLDSTSLYYILPFLYLALIDSTSLHHGSTWLNYTIPCLYYILPGF